MKVFNLTQDSSTYSSNAYFIRGEWNTLDDVNTLIDTGRDSVLFEALDKVPTGVGKTKIEQVLLTHNHYDHTGNLREIISRWHPKVYAASKSLAGVTDIIEDNQSIRIGEHQALVIACPGHSSDSVCYYIPGERSLFTGDTNLINLTSDTYSPAFENCLARLSALKIDTIYPGHGTPVRCDCTKKIRNSLRHVRKTMNPDIHLVRDTQINSRFNWLNIEMASIRVGKIRACIKNNLMTIFSIIVFPEYERRGIAGQTIRSLKQNFTTIVADRVRPEAIDFWRKMEFIENPKGGFTWEKR